MQLACCAVQVLADHYLTLPARIREARQKWAQRKAIAASK